MHSTPAPRRQAEQDGRKHVRFADKTVVVTGAAHGIGRAIATAFAREGAALWLGDVQETELEQSIQACLEAGARTATGVRVDVTSREQVAELFARVGGADILVNVAGGVRGQVGQPLEAVTAQQWQEILDVNLTGTFNCAQAAVPAMNARGGRSEEHTSELQSRGHLVCRLLLET